MEISEVKWKCDSNNPFDIYAEPKDESKFLEGNLVCCAPEGFKDSMNNWSKNKTLITKLPEMLELLSKLEKVLNSHQELDQLTRYNLAMEINELRKQATEI